MKYPFLKWRKLFNIDNSLIGYKEVILLTEVPEGYIGIYNLDDLLAVANNMAGNYIQMNDLDLTNSGEWTALVGPPNGLIDNTYDGNGYAIIGLTGEGIFTGTHSTGIIKNLRVVNADTGGNGAIIKQYHEGKIINCYVSGNSCISPGNWENGEICYCTVDVNIVSEYNSGGICTDNYAEIKYCNSIGSINITNGDAGGLVVGNYSNIHNCFSNCDVTAKYKAGGFIANSYSSIPIKNCYATGNVTSTGTTVDNASAGGFIVHTGTEGSIEDCYATGAVMSNGRYAAGLVCYLQCPILRSFARGNITGNAEHAGGFIAFTDYTSNIKQCFSTGNVTGKRYVGGFTGTGWEAPIEDCYALGSVTSETNESVGGFMGMGDCALKNCYSIGKVNGSGINVGGLIGWQYLAWVGTGIVTNCYYNMETSYQDDTMKGIPKTTLEMYSQSTYENWDFDSVWEMPEIALTRIKHRGKIVGNLLL